MTYLHPKIAAMFHVEIRWKTISYQIFVILRVRSVLCLLVALDMGVAAAHAATVKGHLLDGNGAPVAYATVTLNNGAHMVAGVVTDLDGRFALLKVPAGRYTLCISMVGYLNITRTMVVKSEYQTLDLNTLVLQEDSKMLDAVEVVGQASQMRFDIDKKVFNVDQNLASAGASAADLLENIPAVQVDNDGNISLRNNSSVAVWINGKPSGLNVENRAQILEQIPASAIASVEIVTNPSAKYNPEGAAGIINIVLKKERKAGCYGTADAGLNYQWGGVPSGNAGVNFNYNSTKVDCYVNAGFRRYNRKGADSVSRLSFRAGTHRTDTLTLLEQQNDNNRRGLGFFGRTGATVHLGRCDHIGLSAMLHHNNAQSREHISSQTHFYQPVGDNAYTRVDNGKSQRLSYNLMLDYVHEFDSIGSELQMSASFSQSLRRMTSLYDQQVQSGNALSYQQLQGGNNDMRYFEYQADYIKKIGGNTKIEAGASWRWQNRLDHSSTWIGHLENADSLVDYNDFDYAEYIAALYATCGHKFGSLGAQAGLRSEYTHTNVSTRDAMTDPFVKSRRAYWQLYPTIYLSYAFPHHHELQLNYTRRVNRPRGRQLSAFRNVSDSTDISYGNPNLMPEFANALEMNYIKTWENHAISASLYYRFTTDIIQRVRFQSASNPNVMENTYENIAKSQVMGLEFAAKSRPTSWLNLTANINMFYQDVEPVYYKKMLLQERQQSFSWDVRLMGNFLFTKTFSGQWTGSYVAPRVIAQGRSKSMYAMGIGLRKSFLDRRLNLNVSIHDLLHSFGRKSQTWSDTFYQNFAYLADGPVFRLSISYNFGNRTTRQQTRRRQATPKTALETIASRTI